MFFPKTIKVYYLTLFLILFFFLVLLLKNPFSKNNLIPEFYPYPDSINYINPARSFIKGDGLRITREGRSVPTNVPPLYSLILVPLYLLNNDPRIFYFTNLTLVFIGAFLFYKLLKIFTDDKIIIIFSFFIYLTNLFIFYFPELAMAENLYQPLFLASLLLLFTKISKLKIFLAGILGIAFVTTKYATAPIALSFYFLYFIKLTLNQNQQSKKILLFNLLLFIVSIFLTYSLFSYSEYHYKGSSFTQRSLNLLNYARSPQINKPSNQNVYQPSFLQPEPFFSLKNFEGGWNQYLAGLMGGPMMFAGIYQPMIPIFVGMLGLGSLFYGLFLTKYRFWCFCLIVLLFSSVLFMSTFNTVDGRYIYHSIPILLLSFTIFLSEIKNYLAKKGVSLVFNLIIVGLFCLYLYQNTPIFLKQIKGNIGGNGIPLNYQAVLAFNSYFQKFRYSGQEKKPVLISSLIPYFVDYYSNNQYELLPLSYGTYFGDQLENAWGVKPVDDLTTIYDDYLSKGHPIYVSDVGIYYWYTGYLKYSFNKLKDKYNLKLVQTGCQNKCNLYKVAKRG